jgi:hypothetical protein
MAKRDSLDKIVGSYFAAITTEPFTYNGHLVKPLPLKAGPGLLRGFTCNPNCGGCCATFSLDYLPSERHRNPSARPRAVEFSGRTVIIYSDLQDKNKGPRCRHLQKDTGLCGIHGSHPFRCDFELIRFIPHHDCWTVNEQLFGRGWAMKRVDGGVGALCTIDTPTKEAALDAARRLDRLAEWADHFGLENHRGRLLADYCRAWSDCPADAPRVVFD